MSFVKEKYQFWALGIVVGILLIIINNIFLIPKEERANRTEILVNAPQQMHDALVQTLEDVRLDDDYVLKFTDSKQANFTVNQGLNAKGELIAYSPFVAVFNSENDYIKDLKAQEIFVKSEVDSDEFDFDFKKVIDQILQGETNFKVYYPERDSVYWDEFYSFLLFTVNDGYYPKDGKDMEEAIEVTQKFLNSKNAEPINEKALIRNNGIPKNSIYFMTYVDLARLYKISSLKSFKIMYPTSVVYHSYYADFDETGKVLFDSLYEAEKGILATKNHAGYVNLYYAYYNTLYSNGTTYFSDSDPGKRDIYNGVEIPQSNVTINNSINKEEQ